MYHCFRLHRGDDLYESIQRYADAHHIAAGVVLSAVGCVYRWELRDASGVDVQSGTEDVEIVSLMGTVSEPDTVFTRERDEATGYEELAIRRIDRQF